MRTFRWMRVGSAEELLRFLPAALEEEDVDTIFYNATRWRDPDRLARAVRDTRAIVADNDGSVIPGSQWEDLRLRMSEAHRADDERDAAAYFRGERTDEGDVEFLLRSVRHLADSGLLMSHLRTDARRQLPRPGVRDLMASYGVRSAVVTYGVDTYVQEWVAEHAVQVAEVFAARLQWRRVDDDHVLVGCDRSTVVVEATKGRARERFAHRHGVDGHETLVLEDTPRMLARMKHPNSVGALVLPRRDPQPRRPQERMRQLADRSLFPSIDLVVASDSLEALAAIRTNRSL